LYEGIKNIFVRIHCPPEPAFPTVDWYDHFVQMPFVGRGWPVSPDAMREMAGPISGLFPG
jgi:hypothetical protein